MPGPLAQGAQSLTGSFLLARLAGTSPSTTPSTPMAATGPRTRRPATRWSEELATAAPNECAAAAPRAAVARQEPPCSKLHNTSTALLFLAPLLLMVDRDSLLPLVSPAAMMRDPGRTRPPKLAPPPPGGLPAARPKPDRTSRRGCCFDHGCTSSARVCSRMRRAVAQALLAQLRQAAAAAPSTRGTWSASRWLTREVHTTPAPPAVKMAGAPPPPAACRLRPAA